MLDLEDHVAIAEQRQGEGLARLEQGQVLGELGQVVVQRPHARLQARAVGLLALLLEPRRIVGAGAQALRLLFQIVQQTHCVHPC